MFEIQPTENILNVFNDVIEDYSDSGAIKTSCKELFVEFVLKIQVQYGSISVITKSGKSMSDPKYESTLMSFLRNAPKVVSSAGGSAGARWRRC